MQKIYLLILGLWCLNVCKASPSSLALRASGSDTIRKKISTFQADSLIKTNAGNANFQILDVRTASEVSTGYIKGAANIDFYASDFSTRIDKLDRNKIYLVYCQSGNRSGQAYNLMITLRFREVYSMNGGMSQWKLDKYPVATGPLAVPSVQTAPASGLNLYPNPARNEVYLEVYGTAEPVTLSIYNMQGQQVYSRALKSNFLQLPATHWLKGIYLVKLQCAGAVFTRKLCVE